MKVVNVTYKNPEYGFQDTVTVETVTYLIFITRITYSYRKEDKVWINTDTGKIITYSSMYSNSRQYKLWTLLTTAMIAELRRLVQVEQEATKDIKNKS